MAHIKFVSEVIINNSVSKKFPVIISENLKVHRLSLNYFLDIRPVCSITSIKTYAYHLVDFLTQIEFDNNGMEPGCQGFLDWDEIDDNWIECYANELEERGKEESQNSKNYAGQVLQTVIQYLKWTENKGVTRFLIGEGEHYRIQLENGSHPLVKSLLKDKRPGKVAPRGEWIDAVVAYSCFKERNAKIRFELMVEWADRLALRAHEVCALKISQMPDLKAAQKAIVNEHNMFICLTVTKGSKSSMVPVSPFLVKKTWDFVERERKLLLKKIKNKAKRDKESFEDMGFIFPSSQTGEALSSVTFSNQVRKSFLTAVEAGVLSKDERVWAHGLRHRGSTDQLKKADEKGINNPERVVKHFTRHKNEDTLTGTYTLARHFEDELDES